MPKPTRKTRNKSKQKRPISRTLTTVHENTLNDLVYPAEIVGKRTRVKLDGSKLIKVHLDKGQQTTVEHKVNKRNSLRDSFKLFKLIFFSLYPKVETFTSIYKKLTGKDVHFEFREVLVWILKIWRVSLKKKGIAEK